MNKNTNIDEEVISMIRSMSPDQLDKLKGTIMDYRGMAEAKADKLAKDIKGLDPETLDHMRDAMNWREAEAKAKKAEADAKAEEAMHEQQDRQRDLLTAFGCGGLAVIGGIVGAAVLRRGILKLFK